MNQPIEIAIDIDAPAPQVWSAWTIPDRLCAWFPDRASGTPVTGEALIYSWDSLGMALEFEVLEVIENRRLVLRASPGGGPAQTQAVSLEALSQHRTRVRLRHEGFGNDDDVYRGTESGWRVALQVLKRYVELHCGSTRVNAWMLGLVPARLERVFAHFTEPGCLREWLGRPNAATPHLRTPGTAYQLALPDGPAMTGHVLASIEPRDVALSCEEINGVVVLRSFAVAPGALLVGINMMSWDRSTDELEPAARALSGAVDRLVRILGGSTAADRTS